ILANPLQKLGVTLPDPDARWYGEPGVEARERFMNQARLMKLDAMTDPNSSEPLSERFWRRYGDAAFQLLERIREDEDSVRLLIRTAEYTRCEIELAARREMIVKLDDFMRRRSKIELVVRWDTIEAAPGLRHACEILFPGEAEEKLEEYLAQGTPILRAAG
ncbi:MAG: glycerol-3-phosphate dehydrogenase C-terminal domain-containing protein, partial [Chromatocurvus sp.]